MVVPARISAPEEANDFVVATQTEVGPEHLARAVRLGEADPLVETLLVRPPLFWYRMRTGQPRNLTEIANALTEAELPTRYVTPSAHRYLSLGPRPDFTGSSPCACAVET